MPNRSPRALLQIGALLSIVGCSYDVTLGDVTSYRLAATSCGTWDDVGIHKVGGYFVGHTTDTPDQTLSYFVFDLTPLRGRTVTVALLIIPGTPDWKITVARQSLTPPLQFKLGVTPLPASLTLTQVTDGNDDPGIYQAVHAEQDLGFGWYPSGATTNAYGAFTYDTVRLQDAVNAGGLYPLFAVQRFGETATTPEYFYRGGVCGPNIILSVTVK
jgi:hypothetical protein